MTFPMYVTAALSILIVGSFVVVFILIKRSIQNMRMSEISVLESKLGEKETELNSTSKNLIQLETIAAEKNKENQKLENQISALQERIGVETTTQKDLEKTISRLEAELIAEKIAAGEKIKTLTEIRKDLESKFRELAQEALEVQGKSFSKTNLEKLEATLTPLKEHVGHFEKELRSVHKETAKDREYLKAEIGQLSLRSAEISQEAVALTRALKGDQQKQGAWGEMVLENILKSSGLREGEDFETQAHRTGDDGERLRPDVVVKMPGGNTLVVDSKVSLVAYLEILGAENDEDLGTAKKKHLNSITNHIKGLSGKKYHRAENSTVDYVIMFIPIEAALSEALKEEVTLIELALENNIALATPTTLMMSLRTVANFWAFERRSKNAEEIAARAGRLYDKIVGFVANLEGVGSRLRQAQISYDEALKQLSQGRGNVLDQVENLKSLGAKTEKSIGIEFEIEEGNTILIESEINNEDSD